MSKSPEDISRIHETRVGDPLQQVTKVIQNQSLIEQVPSLAALIPGSFNTNDKERSIYYGTGLTTPKAPAIGLPFDVLGMIFVSEQLRRAGEFKSVIHHIADSHAKTNSFINSSEVDILAGNVKETLLKVAANLKLKHLKVTLASDFDNSRQYQQILSFFKEKSNTHEYVIREMADIEYYRLNHGLSLKLGWIIQGTETAIGADERLFDREYIRIVTPEKNKMSFIYTKPGRTLDPSRPKVSPYIQVPGESRILLKKGENVIKKINDAKSTTGDPNLGGALKHLESIVRTYEKLFEPFGRIPLEEKIQNIIDIATK
jgi:hypothetical protein